MFYDFTGTLKNGNHAKLRNLIQQQPLITSFHLPIFFRPIMTCVMLSWSDCAVTLSSVARIATPGPVAAPQGISDHVPGACVRHPGPGDVLQTPGRLHPV